MQEGPMANPPPPRTGKMPPRRVPMGPPEIPLEEVEILPEVAPPAVRSLPLDPGTAITPAYPEPPTALQHAIQFCLHRAALLGFIALCLVSGCLTAWQQHVEGLKWKRLEEERKLRGGDNHWLKDAFAPSKRGSK